MNWLWGTPSGAQKDRRVGRQVKTPSIGLREQGAQPGETQAQEIQCQLSRKHSLLGSSQARESLLDLKLFLAVMEPDTFTNRVTRKQGLSRIQGGSSLSEGM